jgi:hypothetical protein
MHSKRRHADRIFRTQLRFAEKPAAIYVTRKSTGVELLEGHRPVPYKDCNKDLASRPSAHKESHLVAADHNVQLDPAQWLRRLRRLLRLLRPRQLTRREHGLWPRRR